MNKEKTSVTPLLATFIQEMYTQMPFDMNLVSSDNKKVPVHYTVLILFSKPYRKMFGNDGIKFVRGMDLPIDVPHDVLIKIVETMYNDGVGIPFKMKSTYQDAFKKFDRLDSHLDPKQDLFRAINEALLAPSTRQHDDANDDSDDDTLYENFPQVGIEFHVNSECCQKVYWTCEGTNCEVELISKLINGQIMIYKRKQEHSRECKSEGATQQAEEIDVFTDGDDDHYRCVEMPNLSSDELEYIRELSKNGEKILGSCEFPGCKGGIMMKVVGDKMMVKPLNIPHSAVCQMTTQNRVENGVGSSRDTSSLEKSMDDLNV